MTMTQEKVDAFEAYSFAQKGKDASGCGYRIAEDFGPLKEYEAKDRALLGVL